MDGFEPGEEGRETSVVLIRSETHLVVEVRPGRAGCECFQADWVEAKGGDDILADRRGGGCSEADDRYRWVGGAEV